MLFHPKLPLVVVFMIAPASKGEQKREPGVVGHSRDEPDHAVLVGGSEKCLKLRAEKAVGVLSTSCAVLVGA